ncbi:leucine-rich melanocyte differentiation-associated protein-like [Acanthaster planci]|uniref:Leucine-rich melanocyte differentiation-associated protein-like n=1 Tax=Acanthaster planci TaxID=133434 RepID=A0A8B7XYS3_ACAPL|nr:leucine-rich melanocyte differentiation-associated protein-like [Acanthaster planci]XP_022084924.1 leucine-rich melanocyte differentiation-associated protein-like [Acanthaster planci]XP_022084925.1 leucine-rich melanocyte differentiation-associated protein-like [Acanthaster planci]XP_022084926.1 leucine-rich melanocyte differentiation-associated protein-like [Acanthaster planci]
MDEGHRVSLAFHDLTEIPQNAVSKFATKAEVLDLSHNQISDLRCLESFSKVHTLILDNNNIKSHVKFPSLPSVTTLWVNRNRISNLTVFVETVSRAFPDLRYLSMMNNPAAPSFFNGGSYEQYLDYRHYVISQLPKLTMLDDKEIPLSERQEGEKIYKHLLTRKSSKSKRRSPKKSRQASSSSSRRSVKGDVDLPSLEQLSSGSPAR